LARAKRLHVPLVRTISPEASTRAMWAEKLSRVARTIRSSSLEVYLPRAPLGRVKGKGRARARPSLSPHGPKGAIVPGRPKLHLSDHLSAERGDVGVRRCTLGGTRPPKRSSKTF
jgi:hypothetical protein